VALDSVFYNESGQPLLTQAGFKIDNINKRIIKKQNNNNNKNNNKTPRLEVVVFFSLKKKKVHKGWLSRRKYVLRGLVPLMMIVFG